MVALRRDFAGVRHILNSEDESTVTYNWEQNALMEELVYTAESDSLSVSMM